MAEDSAAKLLRTWFRGELIFPGDAQYDAARAVWNGAIDRRPAAIARCASTADVVAALRVTRELGLEVAVRGGGHSLAGYAVADGAVTIDLSHMRSVRVDTGRRQAMVEAGCLLSDLDSQTQRYGWAVPSGLVSHTGVAGLTLGGGVGWLSRKHGLACDNLLGAQVVLANGDVVVASDKRDPELLWAIRGGGGNFGIVTSFDFQLHEVGPMVSSGAGFYAVKEGPAVLEAFAQFAVEASAETTWIASIWNVEIGSFLPAPCHGKPVVALVFVHVGSPEAGLQIARHLRDVACPLAEVFGPVPYAELQASNDGGWRHGMRRYWKSHYLWDLPGAAIEVFLGRGSSSSGASDAVSGSLQALGGAIGRVPEEETAVGHRGAAFDFMSTTTWTDPIDDDARRGAARRFADAMAPFARGVYVNNLGTEGEERVRAAFGADKYEQLAVLKKRYDPENVFRLNQNIKPAHG